MGGEELVHSVDELRVLVAGSSEAARAGRTKAEIVGRVLGFHELSVREVMLPRTELQALSTSASLDEVLHLAATSGHSRFPVYEDDLDHVVGVLYIKDLFVVLERGTPARLNCAASCDRHTWCLIACRWIPCFCSFSGSGGAWRL